MGHMWGRLWMGVPSASVLNFASLSLPKGILVPLLKKEWSIHILIILLEFHVFCASRVIQAFGPYSVSSSPSPFKSINSILKILSLHHLSQITSQRPLIFKQHQTETLGFNRWILKEHIQATANNMLGCSLQSVHNTNIGTSNYILIYY